MDPRENETHGTQGEGIAIIGMACLFPGAPNLDAYWRNILAKHDAVSDPPEHAWDPELYYDPNSSETDRIYCKKGGYIEEFTTFDPLRYGIPPMSVGGEPDQWLALKIAQDALIDAGCAEMDEAVRHRTAVILGRGGTPNRGGITAIQHSLMVTQTLGLIKSLHPSLSDGDMDTLRSQLKTALPPFGPDVAPAMTPNVIVGRIANRLDLMGPNYTVDAACASSLVAIQMAIRELLDGECDLALAGGSQISTAIPMLGVFCQLGALSRTERIRPFDKDADGTLLGEGIGMVVLKRQSDAERDGDRIYAVVRGVGIASDGRATGIMAPRIEGEELAIRRAYGAAAVDPATVDLIEAHGTGTPVGDVVEIEALCRVFGLRDGDLPRVALGSVKSMISHTMPAAGVAGIIKTALSLHHKVLPPTLHCDEPNPGLELEKTPFYINTETRPWIAGKEHPRRAGVSAFGFGGINAHAVLEEHHEGAFRREPRETHMPDWESELCVFRAETPPELVAKAETVRRYVEQGTAEGAGVRLADVAYTLAMQTQSGAAVTLAIVATSTGDLLTKLERAIGRLQDPACEQIREAMGIYYSAKPLARDGKLAFLFPGEGSQYTNMLADLCLYFPEARKAFDRADRFHRGRSRSLVPSDYVFPRPTFSEEDRQWMDQQLWQMDGAVVSVLSADAALMAVLKELGLKPDAVAGHSSGEYAAFVAAGAAGDEDEQLRAFSDTLIDVQIESEVLDDVGPAALVAFGAGRDDVEGLIASSGVSAVVAMDNCPHQAVAAVSLDDADILIDAARRSAVITERLSFDRPYHTQQFLPYSQRLHAALSKMEMASLRIPLYSCATAAPVEGGPEETISLISEQWSRPVEFTRMIEAMHADGYRVFVEVGPRNNLTAFVEDILRGKRISAVATNSPSRTGLTQLNHAIGQIVAHGWEANIAHLFASRSPQVLDFEAETIPSAGPTRTTMLLETGFPAMELSPNANTLALLAAGPETRTTERQLPPDSEEPLTTSANHNAEMHTEPSNTNGSGPVTPATNGHTPLQPVVQRPPQMLGPAANGGTLAEVAHHFLSTMDHFLQVQERVMGAYLQSYGGGVESDVPAISPPIDYSAPAQYSPARIDQPSYLPDPPAVAHQTPAPTPVVAPPAPPAFEPIVPAPAETSAMAATNEPAASGLDGATLASLLREIVSERTGYPVEVIDINADLEADLGIDSIKRVEILGTLRQQHEGLIDVDLELLTVQRTLQQVIDVLLSAEVVTAPDPLAEAGGLEVEATRDHPLLGSIIFLQPHQQLVARRTFDPMQEVWLRDHTIGRDVSQASPDLLALPVMPLTLSLELLAQAVGELSPGSVVVRLEDVRANRWIAFDSGPQTIEIRASRDPSDPSRFSAEVHNLSEPTVRGVASRPVAEAKVVTAAGFPPQPSPAITEPEGSTPSTFEPENLYRDVMFHGPSWQGVTRLSGTSNSSETANLVALSSAPFRTGDEEIRFRTDPIVLDAAGQLLGFWTAEHLADGCLVFPYRVDAIEIYGPPAPIDAVLTCRMAIRDLNSFQIRIDLEVVEPTGVLIRATGWTDRRFYLPSELRPVALPRKLEDLCTEVLHDGTDDAAIDCEWRLLDVELPAQNPFLARIWSSRILSHAERASLSEDFAIQEGSLRWLAGRHAAKEAVQGLLASRLKIEVSPADISLEQADGGQFHATGTWNTSPRTNPKYGCYRMKRAA